MQCTDSMSIQALTARYNASINALIRGTIKTGVLVDLCGLLKPWVAHSVITRKRYVLGESGGGGREEKEVAARDGPCNC